MPPLLALPFPAIDPVAVAIGPITIKWYALAYIVGLLGGWYYARRLVAADRYWGVVRRPSLNDIDDLIVWVALGVVLGGRIGFEASGGVGLGAGVVALGVEGRLAAQG